MEKTDFENVNEVFDAERPPLEDLQETACMWLEQLEDWARYVEKGGADPIPEEDAYGRIGVLESGSLHTVFGCRFRIGNLTVDGEVEERHSSFDETDEESSAIGAAARENILALLNVATVALRLEHDGCAWLPNDPKSRLVLRVVRDGTASYELVDGQGRTVESSDGWQGAMAIFDRIVAEGGADESGVEMIRI